MRSEPHRIPLSRELTNVLQSLPKIGEYVFPNARSDKGVSKMAMFSAKETPLRKMNRIGPASPSGSIRRAAARSRRMDFGRFSEPGDAGFPRDLLEELLGHQIANSVERPYRRINSFNRRRAFMEAWADFCSGKRRGRKPQTASRLVIWNRTSPHYRKALSQYAGVRGRR